MTAGFRLCIAIVFILLGGSTVPMAFSQAPENAPKQVPPSGVDLAALEAMDLADALDLSISIASGRVQSIDEAPGIVSVITDEDIRRLGVHTLADLLKIVPGFEVLVDGTGRDRIAVRGFVSQYSYSEGVLILFNGHRLNEHMDGGATTVNIRIPLYNIRRVEIIRGPGSALFGSGAYVAVINLIPFSAANFNGVRTAVTAGSFGTQQYSLMGGLSGGNWGVLATAQYMETNGGDLWIPEDQQTPLDRRLSGFFAPVSLAPGFADQSLRSEDVSMNGYYGRFGWNFRFKDDQGGPFLGKLDVLANDGSIGGQQLLFDVSRQFSLGPTASVNAKFSFTQSGNRERPTLLPPDFRLLAGSLVVQFRDGIKIDSSANIRGYIGEATIQKDLSDRQRITTGVAFDAGSVYDVVTRGNFTGRLEDLSLAPESEFKDRPDAIRGSRRISSLFLQDEWTVSKAIRFTAGVRFDHYNDFGSTLNPRAAMVWRMPRNFFSKILYGRAFRAPTFNELNYDTEGLIVGNPHLRPDVINTMEFSLGRKTRNFRGSLNYFINDIDSPIANVRPNPTLTQPFPTATWENGSDMSTHGLEADVRRNFGINHSVFANYTYQRSRFKPSGERVADVPAHLLNVGATVGVTQYVSVSPTLVTRGRRRQAQDMRSPVAGYGLLNLNIRLRNFWGTLELNGTINNALNKKYWDPESSLNSQLATVDYPRPGRQILVGATYRF